MTKLIMSLILVTYILLDYNEYQSCVIATVEVIKNRKGFQIKTDDSYLNPNFIDDVKIHNIDYRQRRHIENWRHHYKKKDNTETIENQNINHREINRQQHHHHQRRRHYHQHIQSQKQRQHQRQQQQQQEDKYLYNPVEVLNRNKLTVTNDDTIPDYLNDDTFNIDVNMDEHNVVHNLPIEPNSNNNNLFEHHDNTKSDYYRNISGNIIKSTTSIRGTKTNTITSSDQTYNEDNRSNAKLMNNNNNGIKCPKCSGSTNKVRVSEEELTELRIDFVKRQILQKLRLKEKPQLTSINFLPKPITEREYEGAKPKENLDDYYARTSKKFLILERETKECARFNKHPSICFKFKIDDVDVDSIDVNQAVLWLHKTESRKDQMKQTLVVSEIDQHHQGNSKYLPKIKPIAMTSIGVDEGWIKIDIAWPIRKWVGYHELSHLIHISCEACELDSADGLVSLKKEYQPFIVIDTQFRRQRQRQKRSVNCTAGVTECCREKLFISFKEIGWSDWIIQPEGYDAYFCRGSCSSAASIAASNNHYSAFVQKLAQHRDSKSGKEPLELIPCCTAKQFSSLQLFYRDSNNTVTLKTLPNMVIEACGCM